MRASEAGSGVDQTQGGTLDVTGEHAKYSRADGNLVAQISRVLLGHRFAILKAACNSEGSLRHEV
eukprot:6182682-Pleurochrysis_carterae.AAC.1